MDGDYLILYTENWEQVVFVPFVCKRCGKCCREVGVNYRFVNWRRVAKYRGISVDKLVGRFGEHIEKHQLLNIPCFFFKDERNECSIYRVRPSNCRSYPLHTFAGDMGIGCPGKIERIEFCEGLAPDYVWTKNKTPICPEVWEEILKILDNITVSDKMKRKFITKNEKEVKGRKQK